MYFWLNFEGSGRARHSGRGLLAAMLCVVSLWSGSAAGASAANLDGAIATVEKIHAVTVASASGPASKLAPLLERYLDLGEIARKVAGAAWGSASEAERRDFRQVLRDVMAVELDRRIRPDDRLRVNEAKPLGSKDVVVLTSQIRRDGSARRLDWKMRPCGGSFCLIDIVGNGASLTVARRDDYAPRLKALGGSLAALSKSLRAELAGRN
jgi:ABC-type transporter MlaC component